MPFLDFDAWRRAFDESLEPLAFAVDGERFLCRPREKNAVLVMREGMTRETVGTYLLAVVVDEDRERLRALLDGDPPPDGDVLAYVVVALLEQYASEERTLSRERFPMTPFITDPRADADERHYADWAAGHLDHIKESLEERAHS